MLRPRTLSQIAGSVSTSFQTRSADLFNHLPAATTVTDLAEHIHYHANFYPHASDTNNISRIVKQVKTSYDFKGMTILNLGCGTKTSTDPSVVNIDWNITLRIRRNPFLRALAPILLNGERLSRYKTLGSNVMVHNLAKGIPFASESVDAVFHSHVLEHLDREVACAFLREIQRVLKPGGFIRIVVPDLEQFARKYLNHYDTCVSDLQQQPLHEHYIALLIQQLVQQEAYGTSQQKPFRRFIENVLLGDARKRGETHRWMYDSVSLRHLLQSLNYNNVTILDFNTSRIPRWKDIGLETCSDGTPHKSMSLYVEANK